MPEKFNMKVCKDFASISHIDCGNCYSNNVELTGLYRYDDTGFFVEIRCSNCGKLSDCGDGEFLLEVATFDPVNETFHMLT